MAHAAPDRKTPMHDLPFRGRTVAVSGAGGSLGQALLRRLHAQGAELVALSSGAAPLALIDDDGQPIPLRQVPWQCGREEDLRETLRGVDILVINHGVNVHGARDGAAVLRSLEVNALSSWRLLELFAELADGVRVQPPEDGGTDGDGSVPGREIWVNTSEAEIQMAVSPLYEISKRLQGQLLSLRCLDLAGPRLRIRRLVLGPFRSALNPIGLMSADFVAREVLRQVGWNRGLVMVTPNPLTYVLMPLALLGRWAYYRAFSRPSR
jgi:NAD(P)-dependent dehydrogenase (short-subunit alcohol dehydrogenase family)